MKIDPERLQYLFGNLPGFPYNTIGTYSRGFLLLYPMVSGYQGSCAGILAQAQARTGLTLADQTRFDILCHLRDHDAYGQELAARFSLSRNTIHHHMTKLLSAHLVKCTVDGNRVYYRANEQSIRRLLERQRELLLPK